MGINIATAWFNRHKVCSLVQQLEGEQDSFPTIVEGGKHYTPLSFKGKSNQYVLQVSISQNVLLQIILNYLFKYFSISLL